MQNTENLKNNHVRLDSGKVPFPQEGPSKKLLEEDAFMAQFGKAEDRGVFHRIRMTIKAWKTLIG